MVYHTVFGLQTCVVYHTVFGLQTNLETNFTARRKPALPGNISPHTQRTALLGKPGSRKVSMQLLYVSWLSSYPAAQMIRPMKIEELLWNFLIFVLILMGSMGKTLRVKIQFLSPASHSTSEYPFIFVALVHHKTCFVLLFFYNDRCCLINFFNMIKNSKKNKKPSVIV